MSSPPRMSLAEKHSTLLALRQHRINTLPSLCLIEKSLAALDDPSINEPMTAAWTYYVASNSLLTELRGLTRTHPFSSHVVEEAKRRVYADEASNRSWNLAWLVLRKIVDEGLVGVYAQQQAGCDEILAEVVSREWKAAVDMLLRYWESPPTQ